MRKVIRSLREDSDLFSSAAFDGKDLMFSDAATELIELPKIMDSFLYLREDYYEAMRALRAGNPPPPPQDGKIKWCTVGHAEQQKCDSLQIPRMECQNASSVEECIQKIMRKEADALAVDGGQVYIAGKCGLVPVMVEQYIQESCPDGGGKGPEWAKGLKSEDYELICPEPPGTTVKHTEFGRCNLAKVPAHAVITREDARKDVVNVLKEAQASSDKLFKSEGERNLLFSDSTKCLQEITQPLKEFLTQKYIDMIEKTYTTGQDKPDLVKSCSTDFC